MEEEPRAENRAQVEARIHALTPDEAPQDEPIEPSPLATEEPVGSQSSRATWAPWLVAGLGAAGAVGGVVVGAMATSRARDAEAAENHREGSVLAGDADRLATTSTILLAAGGAVALAGIIWGVIWAVKGDADREGARVRVDPTGIRVAF